MVVLAASIGGGGAAAQAPSRPGSSHPGHADPPRASRSADRRRRNHHSRKPPANCSSARRQSRRTSAAPTANSASATAPSSPPPAPAKTPSPHSPIAKSSGRAKHAKARPRDRPFGGFRFPGSAVDGRVAARRVARSAARPDTAGARTACKSRAAGCRDGIVEIVRRVLLDKCSSRDWIDSFYERSVALLWSLRDGLRGQTVLGAHRCSSPVR